MKLARRRFTRYELAIDVKIGLGWQFDDEVRGNRVFGFDLRRANTGNHDDSAIVIRHAANYRTQATVARVAPTTLTR